MRSLLILPRMLHDSYKANNVLRWRAFLSVVLLLSPVGIMAEEVVQDNVVVVWSDQATSLDVTGIQKQLFPNMIVPLKNAMAKELMLKHTFTLEISEKPYRYYDSEKQTIFIPLADLYQVFGDLRAKYPQQFEVQSSLLNATLQFYFLSELLRALIVELELEVVGWEAEHIDALVTILLSESLLVEQHFALDAAEEYLLLDQSSRTVQAERFRTEFEADEYRLRKILCLLTTLDTEASTGSDDQDASCIGQFESEMSFWQNLLAEYLKDGGSLYTWSKERKALPAVLAD